MSSEIIMWRIPLVVEKSHFVISFIHYRLYHCFQPSISVPWHREGNSGIADAVQSHTVWEEFKAMGVCSCFGCVIMEQWNQSSLCWVGTGCTDHNSVSIIHKCYLIATTHYLPGIEMHYMHYMHLNKTHPLLHLFGLNLHRRKQLFFFEQAFKYMANAFVCIL